MIHRRTLLRASLAPDELQLAQTQWVLYDAALQKTAAGAKPQSDVFITSENVLQVMDRLTGMYSGLKA